MKKKNLVPVTALCVAGILALGGCAQQEAESQEGDVVDQLLVSESSSSQAAQTFSNIVAIREGDGNPALEKLLQVLQGEEIRAYIEETYETVFPSAA